MFHIEYSCLNITYEFIGIIIIYALYLYLPIKNCTFNKQMQTINKNVLKRYRFMDVFKKNPDGSLTPKTPVNINGITFGPGVSFNQGVVFGGVNLFDYQIYDIAAQEENGVLIIKGFYSH